MEVEGVEACELRADVLLLWQGDGGSVGAWSGGGWGCECARFARHVRGRVGGWADVATEFVR